MSSRFLVGATRRMGPLSPLPPPQMGKAVERAGLGGKLSAQLYPSSEVLVDVWSCKSGVQKGGLPWRFKFMSQGCTDGSESHGIE